MFGLSKHNCKFANVLIIQTFYFMEKINLKKAREVLPYGSVTKISEKTGIRKCDISRILNGLDGKIKVKIEKEVVCILKATQKEIDEILLNK